MAIITIPAPELQINFSKIIQKIREIYLQEALSKTMDIINYRRAELCGMFVLAS